MSAQQTRRPPTREGLVPHDLRGIGLGELVERAAMLTRVDRKYVLDRRHVPGVLAGLDPRTRVLDLGGVRTQSYASTYLDTPDLTGYRSAATGRRRRSKVRTRTYVDSGLTFLEVKSRGPRGRTVKERIRRRDGSGPWTPLSPAELRWVEERLAPLGRAVGPAEMLAPTLSVSFGRATLLMGDGSGRATVDCDLLWTTPMGGALARPDLVVIETKSGSRPSGLDHLLWACGHRPTRISKYATGLAALDPTLPANRWARVLRGSFAAER